MKLLSSSSSSASTTSLDQSLCNSKSDSLGCLAGILRRLLCSGSLPTYPSDQVKDTYTIHSVNLKAKEKMEGPGTPGIVARLMGLESMPEFAPNSIARSRSMNAVDCRRDSESIQGKHRRVKSSSSSFRETPTFIELENDEFLLLSFENGRETKESSSKVKTSELGFGELKQRRAERCRDSKTRAEKVSRRASSEKEILSSRNIPDKIFRKAANNDEVEDPGNVLLPEKNSYGIEAVKERKLKNQKAASYGRELRQKKSTNQPAKEKLEAESSSENSSPVSVLGCGEFLSDLEIPTSEEDSRPAGSNSRRKLSTELESYQHSCPQNTTNSIPSSPRDSSSSILDDCETKRREGKCAEERQKDDQGENYVNMWGEVCRLAARDMSGSNWMYRQMLKLEDFEDIGVDFGFQILEQMLDELVDQLF